MLLVIPLWGNCQVINTIAGIIGGSTSEGIPASTANIGFAGYIAFDDSGNYYFGSNLYKIRTISTSGIIRTIAGNGVNGYSGDGGPATLAKISLPGGIVIDRHNNLYFGDISNNRIRKVDKVTGIITTIAGTGVAGYSGDGANATAATLIQPFSVTIDTIGDLYFVDGGNYAIRKIDTNNIITTIAGIGISGSSGDGGPATAAQLSGLESIKIDNFNNLYVAQTDRIRKINLSTSIITTVAGTGIGGYTGDGGPATNATLLGAVDVVPDTKGNFYISEEYNNIIRKVDTDGIISTPVGINIAGYSGDGGDATAAKLNYPRGITLDVCGNLYILDAQNGRIRKVTYPPILTTPSITISGTAGAISGALVIITAAIANAGSSYTIEWMNHGTVFTTTSIPTVTYVKPPGIDTITARVVPTGYGCWDSATSAGHIVFDGTTGVPFNSNDNGISIYPNPTTTKLSITAKYELSRITIDNLMGQTLIDNEFNKSNNTEIDMSGYPAGVYIVRVRDKDGGQIVRKVVKE